MFMSESSIQMNVIGTLQQKGQKNSRDVCLCNHKATLMMMKEKDKRSRRSLSLVPGGCGRR